MIINERPPANADVKNSEGVKKKLSSLLLLLLFE